VDDVKLVQVLRALADKGRFRMVQEIALAGELSCGQIGELFDVSQPTISHHLKILTTAEVLVVRRDGQHAFISVNHDLLDAASALLPRRLSKVAGRSAPRKRSTRG
jgi:ArsR family transcriptional regulator